MQWSRGTNAGFSTAKAESLYLPVDPDFDRPNVESQERDSDSLLNFIRKLLTLRKITPALGVHGEFIPLHAEPNIYPFVYLRRAMQRSYLVILNPGAAPVQIQCQLNIEYGTQPKLIVGGGVELAYTGGCLSIHAEGISSGIFEMPTV